MASGGYMGRYLLIDLSNNKIDELDFDNNTKRKYIGGYGIGGKYIYENQKPGVDPLGEENILSFMTGPVNGTTIPGSPRYTVCGKSPLTKTWGDSNSGGSFGPMMKKAGFDGVFFNGIAEEPVYLLLENGEAKLVSALSIWGKDTYETEDILKEKYGKKAEVACIGEAGEMKTLVSCIVNRKGKVAGRGGMGAIMGSKKLKAIVILGDMKVPIVDKDLFNKARKKFISDIKNDYGDAEWAKAGGTPTFTEWCLEEQDSPIKNWSGVLADMGNYDELRYDNIKKYIVKKETCFGCPIACWDRSIIKEGKFSLNEMVHTPEYETGAAFGSNCLNTNYESIIKCNDICNRYGIDTMSTGAIVAFAIECFEEGILSKKDTDDLELTWGNYDAIVELTEKIAKREGLGKVLADGVKAALLEIGKDSHEFAMHVGGQELPYHDSRWDPSLAITYAYNPTPGRHTQGIQDLGHKDIENAFPGVDFSMCGGEKKDTYAGRAKSIKIQTNIQHCVNATGICWFAFQSTDFDTHMKYLSAITGWDIDVEEYHTTGERIMNLRQAFNLREGINQLGYKIPKRMLGIPPLKEGKTKGITLDFSLMTKEFYGEMDWDLKTSRPSKSKLKELGLDWLIKDIW